MVPDGHIELTAHAISLDWFATPDGLVQMACRYPRLQGILWDELGEKLDESPCCDSSPGGSDDKEAASATALRDMSVDRQS